MTHLINKQEQSEINYYILNNEKYEILTDKKILDILKLFTQSNSKAIAIDNLNFKIEKTTNILNEDNEFIHYDGFYDDNGKDKKIFKIIKNVTLDFKRNDSERNDLNNDFGENKHIDNKINKVEIDNKINKVEIDNKILDNLKNEYNQKKKKYDDYCNEIKKWQNKIKNLDKKNKKFNKNIKKQYIDNENYQYSRPKINSQIGSNYNSSRFFNSETIQPEIRSQMKNQRVFKQQTDETPVKYDDSIYVCPITKQRSTY